MGYATRGFFACIRSHSGRNLHPGRQEPGCWPESKIKVGGQNERFREHRVSHFRLQTRRERNWCDRSLGTFSIRGLGDGALSIDGHAGRCLSTLGWHARRFGGCEADLEDGEAILAKLDEEPDEDYDWKNSIVDLMKLLKLDSGLGARKQLAKELGYTGALDGSAEMNVWLHKQVMTKLAESGGKVPDSLKA